MNRLVKEPKYRHFRPRNHAVVRIDGKDVYLGKYDSPQSWEKYHRLLADWRLNGNLADRPSGTGSTPADSFFGINCLVEQFLNHAKRRSVAPRCGMYRDGCVVIFKSAAIS